MRQFLRYILSTLSHLRTRFFLVNSLKELFDMVGPVKIFSFVKEIGLYNEISLVKSIFDFIYVYSTTRLSSF